VSRRQAGILLHPTSLPGRFGVGDLGPEAVRFLDWAAAAGQSIWQVLPLGPVNLVHSPYGSPSAFAGNPLLLSPERMVEQGLAAAADLVDAPAASESRVDYAAAAAWKDRFFRHAWERFAREPAHRALRDELESFRGDASRAAWLEDWALFTALRHRLGRWWQEWDRPLRRREPEALARAARESEDEARYQAWLQFLFFRQWDQLRGEAHARGIEILGDAPIYVALDSTEVWKRPDLFQLDDDLRPIAVSGVPPDYFSETGQLWGTPLYRSDRMAAEGFKWWIERMRAELAKVDLLRIDHFRAFQAYWAIPAGAPDARSGRWEPGPGIALFRALEAALGGLPIVAEDLGEITDDVRALRDTLGIPGMRVLQFGLGRPESEHHPSRVPENTLVYTGTHDNDTSVGWFLSLDGDERARVAADLGVAAEDGDLHWTMIRAAYGTAAERAIVPIQDVLGLGSEARMNTPSVARGNWEFRLTPGSLGSNLARRLRDEAAAVGRA
jgi:4-alpha-glucanotransferase